MNAAGLIDRFRPGRILQTTRTLFGDVCDTGFYVLRFVDLFFCSIGDALRAFVSSRIFIRYYKTFVIARAPAHFQRYRYARAKLRHSG